MGSSGSGRRRKRGGDVGQVAVRIRLMRMGRRNRPYYRIVVADSRASRDGKYIESLGSYDPINPPHLKIDEEKAFEWIRKGAEISDSARKLLSKQGVLKKLEEFRLRQDLGAETRVRKEGPTKSEEGGVI